MLDDIELRESKEVPPQPLLALFRKEEWNDFMELDDVEFYLRVAVYVVTAWRGDELIGFARVEGDGRITAEISDVLVRSDCQGQGVGTDLVRRLIHHIRRLDPYYIQVNPIGDREAHLYEKFGFREIPNYRKMELITPKLGRKIAEVRGREKDAG